MKDELEDNEESCSHCGNVPDGFHTDHIIFYRCGHAYCEHCQSKFRKNVAWPAAWCERCQKVVYTNYALDYPGQVIPGGL